MKTQTVAIVICFLLPVWRAGAQWLSLPFDRITIESGLPNPSVLDIIQDRQGFMWFATLNGIVRYDGYRMKIYYPSAVPRDSLPERDVPRMFQDKAGNIWVGLMYQKARLFRYDVHTDDFIPYLYDPSKPADQQAIQGAISTFAEDKLGRLLAGTWDDGLYVIEVQKEKEGMLPAELPFKHFKHIPGDTNALASNNLQEEMEVDSGGNIWIPNEGGLCKFTPGSDSFKTYRFSKDTAPYANECVSVHFEPPRTLWVGAGMEGLIRFDLPTETVVGQYKNEAGNPFSITGNWVSKITPDKTGKFWLGVGRNIDIFDPATGKFYHVKDRDHTSYDENFPNNNALICDYSGNMWAATWQYGIYKYNPDKGRFNFLRPNFYQKIKQNEYPVTSVWEDNFGNLWLGTTGDGLVRWNRKNDTYRHFRHQPGNANSLSSNEISGIAADADGRLWVGTSTGLDRLNPAKGEVRRYRPFEGEEAVVWQSKKGDIWALNFSKGLCRLLNKEKGDFKYYPLQDMGLTTIEEDETGKLYVGINQWGFWILDPETDSLQHFLPEYGVHDVHFDRHGQCWLATHSGGLKLWDRNAKRLIHLPKAEHDKIGIARGILEDDKGFLWIKTPAGIVQFDPAAKKVLRHYSARNWMDKDEPWYVGSSPVKTRSGEMFFPSLAGMLYFHPDNAGIDPTPPKIAFTEFRLFNQPVKPGEDSLLKQHISQTRKIELEHWQNDFAFEFAALHFKSPEENEYAFFLENYDDDWRYAGRDRTAAYTNLDPGHYTFFVKAANSDGVWSKPVAMEIVIRSPWWATWWAYLLYLTAALALLLGIRRYELNRQKAKDEARRLEELDAFKTRFYTNLTHEFRTPLTIIIGLTEQLKAQASTGVKMGLDMIRRNGRQLLRLVNQMLELSKVESGHLHLRMAQADVIAFLKYLFESYQSLAAGKKIRLHFQSGPEALFMDYDPERLQSVVGNLLSNAVKFTPEGGEIWLLAEQIVENQAPKLQVSVRDSGPGIPEDQLTRIFDRFYQANPESSEATRAAEGAGIGLTLARELVKLMQGSISVRSEVGKGAAFTVLLPIQRSAAPPANDAPAIRPELLADLAIPPTPMPKQSGNVAGTDSPLILLIEDNADVVRYLYDCLGDRFRVAAAHDGEEGIAKAIELVPDLVVSDVMMPRRDGFQVCHALKTDERTSHIPIILLTAKADTESRLTGLRRGADAYLAKPFHREELLLCIQNLLDVRRKLHAHYRALAGLKENKPAVQTPPDEAMEAAFVQKVRALIETDFNVQWQVPELAGKLFVSESQLHRKLKALTGMHTTEFVRYLRLCEAARLLREQPGEKVSAIAYDVGFENVNEFNRRFKEVFKMAPGEWRKNKESVP